MEDLRDQTQSSKLCIEIKYNISKPEDNKNNMNFGGDAMGFKEVQAPGSYELAMIDEKDIITNEPMTFVEDVDNPDGGFRDNEESCNRSSVYPSNTLPQVVKDGVETKICKRNYKEEINVTSKVGNPSFKCSSYEYKCLSKKTFHCHIKTHTSEKIHIHQFIRETKTIKKYFKCDLEMRES